MSHISKRQPKLRNYERYFKDLGRYHLNLILAKDDMETNLNLQKSMKYYESQAQLKGACSKAKKATEPKSTTPFFSAC